jgi:hypothetical protein
MLAHANAQAQKISDETLDRVELIRRTADVEFEDELEEQRLRIALIKDDGITELNREIDEKLDEFRERAAEIVEEIEQHAEEMSANVRAKLDRLAGREREVEVLGRERELIESEWACLQRGREQIERERECLDRGRKILEREWEILARRREILERDKKTLEAEKQRSTGHTTGGRE